MNPRSFPDRWIWRTFKWFSGQTFFRNHSPMQLSVLHEETIPIYVQKMCGKSFVVLIHLTLWTKFFSNVYDQKQILCKNDSCKWCMCIFVKLFSELTFLKKKNQAQPSHWICNKILSKIVSKYCFSVFYSMISIHFISYSSERVHKHIKSV